MDKSIQISGYNSSTSLASETKTMLNNANNTSVEELCPTQPRVSEEYNANVSVVEKQPVPEKAPGPRIKFLCRITAALTAN